MANTHSNDKTKVILMVIIRVSIYCAFINRHNEKCCMRTWAEISKAWEGWEISEVGIHNQFYVKKCPPEEHRARWASLVVLVSRGRQTQHGSRGGVDWWLQLSQRRGTQADSWSPVAPDMTVIEAHGIVFHCRGQPVRRRVQAAKKTNGRAERDAI